MAIINAIEDFMTLCIKGQKIISIDHGIKKIGIALSSADHAISFPSGVILYESDKKLFKALLDLISGEKICAIIVGLPVNMDSTESEQTLLVRTFVEKLSKRINLPIYLQDERLTSKMADNFLKSFGLNRKKRESLDDAVAANMILETVLQMIQKQY